METLTSPNGATAPIYPPTNGHSPVVTIPGTDIPLWEFSTNAEKIFVTAKGYRLQFQDASFFLSKLTSQLEAKKPPVPTYTLPLLGGGTETHAHFFRLVEEAETDPATGLATGKTVQREETSLKTPEDRAAWLAYQRELAAYNAKYAAQHLRVILLKGVTVLNKPDDSTWMPAQELMGIEVPTEPTARHLHWLESEMLASADEAKMIVTQVYAAAGASEEVVAEITATFRHQVGGTKRDAAGAPEHPAGTDGGAGVVPQQTV